MSDSSDALCLRAADAESSAAWTAQWHAAFTEAFADYLIGPFTLTLSQWPGFLARQGIDLSLSRGAFSGGSLAAFALVAPRAALGRWRLGTMGARPAARGSGAGQRLLDDFIERSRQAGMHALELEVFAANERAVRLYRSRGFEIVHPLWGYERSPSGTPARLQNVGLTSVVQAVPLKAAWRWLDDAQTRIDNLPLQVTSPVLQAQASTVPMQAWQCAQAQLVFSEPAEGGTLTLHSLVDHDPQLEGAQALAEALVARFPDRPMRAPQLHRPDLGGDALVRIGFQPLPLHQWLMQRPV
ncbi:GNAT family N-acetyltransferase [Ideonella sp. DXS29W]|uniref:GNAT family N-acetyltransferase n=1 Tax=Ideonella lacteola TaxID=2984193 RepID=A0ABU9BLJ3_9BURK